MAMIGALVWKEWRECRWKMLGIFMVYMALAMANWVALYFAPYREGAARDILSRIQISFIILTALFPGFVAMGTITEEKARRTAETLRVLPVGMGRVFLVKCLWGMLTLVVPLLAVQMAAWFVMFPEGRGGIDVMPLAKWCGFSAMATVCMYAWILALGVRCRSEFQVALLFVAFLFFNVLWLGFVDLGGHSHLAKIFPVSWWLAGPPSNPNLEWGMALNFLLLGPLVAWACRGYGRARALRRGSEAVVAPATARQWRRPLVAQRFPVVWKTWRENRVLVLGYLSLAMFFLAAEIEVIWYINAFGYQISGVGRIFYGEWLFGLPEVMCFLVAIILGVDIGLRDFENRVERFWQARPIPSGSYFGKRFALGAAFALAMAVIPMLMLYAGSYDLTHLSEVASDFLRYYAPQVVLVYGASVLFATLINRRVVSMVAGLAVAVGLQMPLDISRAVYDLRDNIMNDMEWALAYFVVIAIATAGLGWLAALSIRGRWRERLDVPLAAGRAVKA
jgi:ABC-type transport system involved in multi-copper enzyme maturation permease subunit